MPDGTSRPVEAWPWPSPRRRSLRGTLKNAVSRPRTPISYMGSARDVEEKPTGFKLVRKWLCKLLQRRHLSTSDATTPNSSPPDTPDVPSPSSSSRPSSGGPPTSSASSGSSQQLFIIRPVVLSREREAAAVSAGVDISTYNMLMDLQFRDILPEDYDTLRRLDNSVTPRTLTLARLDKECPSWQIPAAEASSAAPATATRSDLAMSKAAAAAQAAAPPPTGACDEQAIMLQTCCICLELFAHGECVRQLPCKHSFHRACIVSGATRPPAAAPPSPSH